ncbi:exo-alpha-sialidase [Chitinophaga sp. XS-30]|uniref:sialidase family protein n=1 Tax=Chitinophaga sp. XS-30 TaxID=2604421 RepID=UPI001FEF4DC9|nr:sialidase family protein [Chitinophaga sp. XS-30]
MKKINFFSTKMRRHNKVVLVFSFILVAMVACKKTGVPPDAASEPGKEIETRSSTEGEFTTLAFNTPIKLFDGGSGLYHSYRIPSIIRTKKGTLIAFCEARVDNNRDYGNINVICRRSATNGSGWGPEILVKSTSGTWGNPTAVVNQSDGKIWLFMSYNDAGLSQFGDNGTTKITQPGQRKTFVCYSTFDQDGNTWSTPVNITNIVKPANMVWDAMGPGIGIQKRFGATAGRLIIPASGRNIYSDNNGTTWQYESIPGGTSEGTIVERLTGVLMRNDRGVGSAGFYRYKSVGGIGTSWTDFEAVTALPDPHCQGSILRYTDSPSRILFMNSASQSTRTAMRIRISNDEGISWPTSKAIPQNGSGNAKLGGYSSMVKTADNMIGALIEFNENTSNSESSNRSIYFHKFNLAWF